jgi:hypothetical protein
MNDDDSRPRLPLELPVPLALAGVFPWTPPYKASPVPFFLRPAPPERRAHKPRIDITGERHGALVASTYDADRGRGYWCWACDCGGQINRTSDAVRRDDGPRDCGPTCSLRRGEATP